MTQVPLFADHPAAEATAPRRRQVRRVRPAPRGVQAAFSFPATPCRCAAAPAPVAEVAEPAAAPAVPAFAPVAAAPELVETLAPVALVESASHGRGEKIGVAQVVEAQALTAQAAAADAPPVRGGLLGRVAQAIAAAARRVAQVAGRVARSLVGWVAGRRSPRPVVGSAAVAGSLTPTSTPTPGAARPPRIGGVAA